MALTPNKSHRLCISYGFIADDAWFLARGADKGLPTESDYYASLKNAVDAVAIENTARSQRWSYSKATATGASRTRQRRQNGLAERR